VREPLVLLAQNKRRTKRQPNRAAFGSLEINRFRRARSHSLQAQGYSIFLMKGLFGAAFIPGILPSTFGPAEAVLN